MWMWVYMFVCMSVFVTLLLPFNRTPLLPRKLNFKWNESKIKVTVLRLTVSVSVGRHSDWLTVAALAANEWLMYCHHHSFCVFVYVAFVFVFVQYMLYSFCCHCTNNEHMMTFSQRISFSKTVLQVCMCECICLLLCMLKNFVCCRHRLIIVLLYNC